jgi:hypothetical protein
LSFREKMQGKKGVLLKNTIMLYILQFSTYLLAFIVVPYETRVLGPTVYGKLGVATAIMVYFQLVIDFGFILSATEDVSRNREDNAFLRNIFTSVTVAKLFLTAGSLVVLMVLCRAVRSWQGNTLFFTLFFAATAINSMMPDYLYRGLEGHDRHHGENGADKALFHLHDFRFAQNARAAVRDTGPEHRGQSGRTHRRLHAPEQKV